MCHIRARVILFSLVLLPPAARGVAGEEVPAQNKRPLYPFQGEIEAQIKGAPSEAERAAALLPLRILLARHAVKGEENLGGYLDNVLDYVEVNNVQEALPLLERALRPGNPLYDVWDPYRARVATVYIKVKTAGMDRAAKARFLVSLMKPDRRLAIRDVIKKELVDLREETKPLLLDMLRGDEGTTLDDYTALLMAFSCAAALAPDALGLEEKEVEELLAHRSDFVRYVAAHWLVDRKDPRALDLVEHFWQKHPIREEDWNRSTVRGGLIMDETAAIPGAMNLFLKLFKMLDKDTPSRARESQRWRLYSYIWRTESHPKPAEATPELRAYIEHYLKEKPNLPAREPSDFLTMYDSLIARDFAQRVLDMWDKGKQDKGENEGGKPLVAPAPNPPTP